MRQLRHTIQTLIILTCLVWGGHQWSAQAEATPLSDGSSSISLSDQDIADLYPDLPLAVSKAIPSVVATQQVLDQTTGKGIVASGVVLNDQQILTAGHTVADGGRIMCSQTRVLAPGVLSDAGASSDQVIQASARYGKGTDLAVLTVQAGDNFRKLPDIKLGRQAPQKGDTVYFINFQPTADGVLRSPAAIGATDPAHDYSKPVIFAGTYLGQSEDGPVIATGYGKSYGRGAPDIMVRKGASGGAVLNGQGELVGLSVSSQSLSADRSSAWIAHEYGVRMPQQDYQLAYIQTVSKSVASYLQKSTVSCDKL
jgi:S1-C subfamily serine protease